MLYYLSAENFCTQIIRTYSLEINKYVQNKQGPAFPVPWISPSDAWNNERLISRDYLSYFYNDTLSRIIWMSSGENTRSLSYYFYWQSMASLVFVELIDF